MANFPAGPINPLDKAMCKCILVRYLAELQLFFFPFKTEHQSSGDVQHSAVLPAVSVLRKLLNVFSAVSVDNRF